MPDRRFRVNPLIRVPPDSQPEAPLRLTSKQRRKAHVNDKQGNHHRDAEGRKPRKDSGLHHKFLASRECTQASLSIPSRASAYLCATA
jgi:hypothetical protein